MGDGFTLNKAHKQYLENLELWNYVQALDAYTDDLEDELSERQTSTEANNNADTTQLIIGDISGSLLNAKRLLYSKLLEIIHEDDYKGNEIEIMYQLSIDKDIQRLLTKKQ